MDYATEQLDKENQYPKKTQSEKKNNRHQYRASKKGIQVNRSDFSLQALYSLLANLFIFTNNFT